MKYAWLFCILLVSATAARPWNLNDLETGVEVVQQELNPLTKTIDSMTSRFSRTLKTLSPSLTTTMSIASLAYMGYVASVMLFPTALKDIGVPVLDDIGVDQKSSRTAETGLIDSLATELMKDMIGRTEAAVILRNTSMNAVKDGINTLKRTTRFVNFGLGSAQGLIKKILTALEPRCLARSMCQVGQFTSLHFPALGPVLRSVNTFELDEFSQALIDGTSVGDCSAIYFDCAL